MITPFDFQVDLNSIPNLHKADPTLPRRKIFRAVPGEPDCYALSIDNTSLEHFQECARRAQYYLIEGREPATPATALSFGGAIHKALEVIIRYGVTEQTKHEAKARLIQHFDAHPVGPDEYRNLDMALSVFDRYTTKHPLELWEVMKDANGEPMVEISFECPLGSLTLNGPIRRAPRDCIVGCDDASATEFFVKTLYILWTGRIDAILYWDGEHWVLDHKTTSIAGPGFFNDFILSQQTVGYAWAGSNLLKLPVKGLVLNALMARRPTKTGVSIEFDRRRYIYSPEMLHEWEENTLATVSDFIAHLQRGFFPMQTKWCQGKYGQCKYHEVCVLGRQHRLPYLQSELFRDVTWSPLAKQD